MSTPSRKSDAARNLLHPLGVAPGLGRMREERDHGSHVEQMMQQLLLTDFGERVMRPKLGTGIRGMVFAPIRGISETLIQANVWNALETWLGDVIRTETVGVSIEEETIHVRIVYQLTTVPGRRILSLETSV